jgi:uncharacterized protein (TIGR02588 family)
MKRTMPARKLAEWITLAVSTVTILALVAYLLFEFAAPASPFVELVATPLFSDAQKVGESFVLPIDIENRGRRTVALATFRITIAGANGEEYEHIELQYLARTSKQRIYKYLAREPKRGNVRIVPGYYRLE